MIHTIALDDEPPALKVLENFCGRTDFLRLEKTFTQPGEARNHLLKFPVDLLFLDIRMPSVSGIDFYKAVGQDTMVVFTTAYSEYAVEGFNLSAIDYLLKPYTYERFLQAAQRAREYYGFTRQAADVPPQHLYVRADYSLMKVALADILYVEGLDDYLKIFLQNGEKVVARMTLKALSEKLPTREFLRIHRSFIVPVSRISQVRNKVVSIAGMDIPIGKTYEEEFFRVFQ